MLESATEVHHGRLSEQGLGAEVNLYRSLLEVNYIGERVL